MIQAIAVALAVISLLNTLFVFVSLRTYLRGERHPILLGLLVTTTLIWAVGGTIGLISARYAVGLPPLPAGGLILGWALIAVSLLPAYLWAVMRRFRA